MAEVGLVSLRWAGRRRWAMPAPLPWALLGLVAVLTTAGVGLIVAADLHNGGAGYHVWGVVAFAVTFPVLPVMGALLAARRPGNPLGWLFLGSSLVMAASAFAHGYGEYGVEAHPGSLPGAAGVLWLGTFGWLGFAVPAVFAPLLYPDGRFASRRWKAVAAVELAVVLVVTAALAVQPGPYDHFDIVDNPLGVPGLGGLGDALRAAAGPALAVAMVVSALSLAGRFRASSGELRRQLVAFVLVFGLLLAVDACGSALLPGGTGHHPALCSWADGPAYSVFGTVLPMILYVGLPVAVAVAVLRHNLYGIDRLVRRSAVYATLWAAIALAYLAVAWALGIAVTGRLPVAVGVGVTIAATMVFQPARRRLERIADRWVFGRRPSGYELASDLGASLGAADDLEEVAGQLAEIVCRGLELRWATVRLTLGEDAVRVSRGPGDADAGRHHPESSAALVVPVTHLDRRIGTVWCGPPAEGGRLRPEHADIVDLLTRQTALAVHNVALARDLAGQVDTVNAQAAELSASRARIVTAQEAERRRIERNIHDGAQQDLVAIMAKVRLARDLMGRDPDAAAGVLEDLGRDARGALVGIRELAQGIHPAVLADQGLASAIEDRTARLPLDVTVRADLATRSTRLPNALEGAAFFVVSEALANVLKHGSAQAVSIDLRQVGGSLTIEVADDGCGFDPARTPQTGLVSLADRVGALGGTVAVSSRPGAGTTLRARMPLRSVGEALNGDGLNGDGPTHG